MISCTGMGTGRGKGGREGVGVWWDRLVVLKLVLL